MNVTEEQRVKVLIVVNISQGQPVCETSVLVNKTRSSMCCCHLHTLTYACYFTRLVQTGILRIFFTIHTFNL